MRKAFKVSLAFTIMLAIFSSCTTQDKLDKEKRYRIQRLGFTGTTSLDQVITPTDTFVIYSNDRGSSVILEINSANKEN